MADVTISQLTNAIPLSGAEFPFTQNNITRKASIADLPFFKYVAKAYGYANTTANIITTASLNATKRNDLYNGTPVYDTSSYKYICPVTGLYFVSGWASFGAIGRSTPQIRMYIEIQNSDNSYHDQSFVMGNLIAYSAENDCRCGLSLTDFFYCKAGQKILMKVYSQFNSFDYFSYGNLTVALANYAE